MIDFTIYSSGFDLQQQESIAAVLDIASSGLNNSWHFIDHVDSDVFMINIDSEEGLQFYSKHKSNSNSQIILVAEENKLNDSNFLFLTLKKQEPPSLRMLVEILNQVEVSLLEALENPSSSKAEQQQEKNQINPMDPSLEESKSTEMNIDSDEEWEAMLGSKRW